MRRFSESEASSAEGDRERSPTPKVSIVRKPEIPAALREVTGLRETTSTHQDFITVTEPVTHKSISQEVKKVAPVIQGESQDVTPKEAKIPTEEFKLRKYEERIIRRTPERTQSMRERRTPDRGSRSSPQRAASFKESDTAVVQR